MPHPHHSTRRRFPAAPAALLFALLLAPATWAARPLPLTAGVEPALPESLPLLAQADPGLAAASAAEPEPMLAPEPAPARKPTASQSVTVNLIHRLVQKGVLAKEDAADLMQQAEAEATEAQQQAAAQQQQAIRVAVAQATEAAKNASWSPDPALLPAEESETVRVTYIPENIKAEMREQLKAEMFEQAKNEHWAAPRTLPEWAMRIRLFGDVRVRYDGTFFPDGNDKTGAFPNFNAINTGNPFDIAGTEFSPQLNVDEDRNRLRLRVRLGLEANLGDNFVAGLRIGTGENNNPVSLNQSLGAANQGQGGNFSKYAIWLDRGFLGYNLGQDVNHSAVILAGRFENPFFRTSEIIWDEDLGFDGVALKARYDIGHGFTPFLAGGAFPVFNTDFNFASNQPDKFKSEDKWLYGVQLGSDWNVQKDLTLRTAAAYYHFDNVEGQISDPFLPLNASDRGNTDDSRPSFAQNGNTYRPIRRIISSSLNNFGTTNQFQYFGLATPFHELHLAASLVYDRWRPFQINLFGEFVKNLAFNQGQVNSFAINNRGPNSASGRTGRFAGGDMGWIAGIKLGQPLLLKRGDWNVGASYRYVESDATVDGFADSDFGLGGTNVKGYTVNGSYALSPNFFLNLRWMSSDQVAGPPLAVDILQFDVNAKF